MNYDCLDRVSEKTNGHCGFPGCTECNMENLEVHHIYPRGRGGNSQSYNLVYLCSGHHRFFSNSVHNSNESLVLIQELYAPNKELCMIDRNERVENKKQRSKINKAVSEKRKREYRKAKDSKPKPQKDKNIERFRDKLRTKGVK